MTWRVEWTSCVSCGGEETLRVSIEDADRSVGVMTPYADEIVCDCCGFEPEGEDFAAVEDDAICRVFAWPPAELDWNGED